jgi:hypothetical protein
MPGQFEIPEATKLEDETISDATAEKKIQHTAEKAAEKSSKTEQCYDQDHSIFSK